MSKPLQEFGKDASIVPSTVTKISTGEVTPLKPESMRKPRKVKPRSSTVQLTKLDEQVLRKAVQLAGKDYSRIQTVDGITAIVWNHPRPWPKV